jgi:hypothetical protein
MPQPAGQGFVTPQQQMIPRTNHFQTSNAGNQSAQGTPTTSNATSNKVNTTCFNCGQKSHYANRCPSRRKSSTPTPGMPTPPPSRIRSSIPAQAQQNYAQGRVNQVLMRKLITPQPWSLVHILSISFRLNHSLHYFLFCSLESQGEIPIKGVVLSCPKISNFEM